MKPKAVFCVIHCSRTGRSLYEYRSGEVSNPHCFGLFGGGVDKGEKPLKAMTRELLEETGFDFKHFDASIDAGKVRLYGKVVKAEFAPRLSWESEDFVWSAQIPKPEHKYVRKYKKQLLELINLLSSAGA